MKTSDFLEWVALAFFVVTFIPFILGGFIIYRFLVNEGFLLEGD
jgi:hypothetical protein